MSRDDDPRLDPRTVRTGMRLLDLLALGVRLYGWVIVIVLAFWLVVLPGVALTGALLGALGFLD